MVCIYFIDGAMFNKTPKQTTVNPLYKVHTLCAIEPINTLVNTDFGPDISVKYFIVHYRLVGQIENMTIKECSFSLLNSNVCFSITKIGPGCKLIWTYIVKINCEWNQLGKLLMRIAQLNGFLLKILFKLKLHTK